ncbi:TPA: sugar ABC transporter ATP-binding protein [Klebsiella pneumoniae]
MAEPLLRMSNISKRFGNVMALDDVSMTIAAGEVHTVVGQNGAGKSTLIKILTGVYTRSGGTIEWQGKPLDVKSPREAQAAGIVPIYQELTLVPQRTVVENVILGYEPRTAFGLIDWKAAEKRTREVLGRFGIDIDIHRPLGSYPTAIQQLVAIGRAASLDAKLLIMDEPTSSLDEKEVEVLFGVIRELQKQGTAVLYVSHFLDELFTICAGATILRNGRTVRETRMKDTSKLHLIADMLGHSVENVQAAGASAFASPEKKTGAVVYEARDLASDRRLSKFDLTVCKGQIVGLAGLLGSGRSEAARAMFGLDKLNRGSVQLNGQTVLIKSPRDAIAAGLAFLSEDRKTDGIIPDLSVRENLSLALLPRLTRMGIVDRAKEQRIVELFIKSLGIKTSDMEQPIRELSGGNQQKVLLGRWLALEPSLLILDEPTRGVDVGARRDIQQVIRDRVLLGDSVLLISSEFEELIEGAHDIVVMQEGRSTVTLCNPGVTEDHLIHAIAGGTA